MSLPESDAAEGTDGDFDPDDPRTILGLLDDSVKISLDEDHVAFAEQLVRQQYDGAREELRSAWRELDLCRGQRALVEAHGWRIVFDRIQENQSDTRTVHIDSLVLADCYQSLFADPEVETIVYLTGVELDERTATVNRRIEMDHEVQSAVKAVGSPDGSFDTLMELEKSDHRLLAHCHNHPGANDTAPEPSDVDRTYQDQLEGGGYDAVGLIMSVDGYVRIFTNDLDVDVTIHGNHVKRLDESKLYLEEPARNASTRIEDA